MKVPRPSGGSRQSNGVGKIYVKYDNNESASKALRALAGRKFADRTVVVTFFGEVCGHPSNDSSLTCANSCFRSTLMLTHGKLTTNLIHGRYWQSCNVLFLERRFGRGKAGISLYNRKKSSNSVVAVACKCLFALLLTSRTLFSCFLL